MTDFPDRNATKPVATNSTLNIPEYNPNFQGEAGKLRRQALSYAINREEIAKVVFNGTRTPAKAFVPPVIDGFKEDLKGSEILKFDADKAKELWAAG